MSRSEFEASQSPTLLQALAEFRYHLRTFVQFSEQVAQDNNLRPRQHQLLLQIAGIPDGRTATINYLAERLGLRQNSVVELADRSVAEGLVRRTEDSEDRRKVVLSVTGKGMRLLDALSASHARELDEFGPRLIRALDRVKGVRTEKSSIRTLAASTSAGNPRAR
jgi:DNA-binding MarR family transcriptional regulator